METIQPPNSTLKENLAISRSTSVGGFASAKPLKRNGSSQNLRLSTDNFSNGLHDDSSLQKAPSLVGRAPSLERSQSLNASFAGNSLRQGENNQPLNLGYQPQRQQQMEGINLNQGFHSGFMHHNPPTTLVPPTPQINASQFNSNMTSAQFPGPLATPYLNSPYPSVPSYFPTPFQNGVPNTQMMPTFSPNINQGLFGVGTSPMVMSNRLAPTMPPLPNQMFGTKQAFVQAPNQQQRYYNGGMGMQMGQHQGIGMTPEKSESQGMLEHLKNVMKNHPISATSTRFNSHSVHAGSQFLGGSGSLESQVYESVGITWSLKDILPHVYEFSRDQFGSRFIQHKLQNPNVLQEDKDAVFEEFKQYLNVLCKDVFGNYVVQKILDVKVGSVDQHNFIFEECIKGKMQELSTHMYGCRVVQKLIEQIFGLTAILFLKQSGKNSRLGDGLNGLKERVEQGGIYEMAVQDELLQELAPHISGLVTDQNGNHVVQKCIEQIRPISRLEFFFQNFEGQYRSMSKHPYGCRVVQRVLENSPLEVVVLVVKEILQDPKHMIKDQYANYVVQHIIEKKKTSFVDYPDEEEKKKHEELKIFRQTLFNLVTESLEEFATHKFGSNVVECCIKHGSQSERNQIIEKVLQENVMQRMMTDAYANYVVQKVIDKASPAQQNRIFRLVQTNEISLRKLTYGKHIINKLRQSRGPNLLH
eukprot:maker-scaffold_8-snap-gene-12.52-mRNA-1 protein AED:0.00 eAED:0.00 QI:218/1/1/1/1/1/2/204/698